MNCLYCPATDLVFLMSPVSPKHESYFPCLFLGLLAGLWEFPSLTLSSDCQEKIDYGIVLAKYCLKVQKPAKLVTVGEVSIFLRNFSSLNEFLEIAAIQ